MNQLAEQIISEFSFDNVKRHMTFLVDEVGERLSGTKEIVKAAEYINAALQSYSLEARIDEFPMYHSFPLDAELKILSPVEEAIPARPVCHIKSTSEQGLTGELVYVGVGGYEDYAGKDVRGKVVLADMNWAPARPEKAVIAYEKGAAALIIMNWGLADKDNPVIQMGAVKSQWGNPTPESFIEIPEITVLTISRYHGEYLKDRCRRGKVEVWCRAGATREWVTAKQPTAYLPCGGESEQFVIVGSHLDAWGRSAICNSTGNALLLELARLFQKYQQYLKRNIYFIFWDGHEIAEGGGSTYFVDTNWDKITKNCVGYINADNLAIGGTTIPTIESNSELKEYLQNLLQEVWGGPGHWITAYKGGGDSSFFGVGVPYISFATEYTEEKLAELNYAVYGPWLHTDEDSIDKVDFALFQKTMEYFATLTAEFCTMAILPYHLSDFAAEIQSNLFRLQSADENIYKEYIAGLLPVADELTVKVAVVDKLIQDRAESTAGFAAQVNWLHKQILRNLYPVFRCYTGRYGQDACGSLLTEKPVPALHYAMERLSELEADTHEYRLWETKLLRERNRVFDALNDSVFVLETWLSGVKQA